MRKLLFAATIITIGAAIYMLTRKPEYAPEEDEFEDDFFVDNETEEEF